MVDAQDIIRWQQELRAQPVVWGVYVTFEGQSEFTGNIYDSKEAAELEADFERRHGNKSARVRSLGNIHNLKLSQERWT